MKELVAGITALGLAVSAQSQGLPAIGLPVDDAENAPSIVAIWPDDGCRECVRRPDLVSSYESARDAIFRNDEAVLKTLQPRIVRIVSYSCCDARGYGGYKHKDASFSEIRTALKGCSLAAQGMIRPNPAADKLETFGMGFDCSGKEERAYMSMSFKDNKLQTVFLMPDRPFYIASAR